MTRGKTIIDLLWVSVRLMGSRNYRFNFDNRSSVDLKDR